MFYVTAVEPTGYMSPKTHRFVRVPGVLINLASMFYVTAVEPTGYMSPKTHRFVRVPGVY